jgi:hypothetical protein
MVARKDLTDLGKISLWIEKDPTSKVLTSGKITMYGDNGSDVVYNVIVLENTKKLAPNSPDYYGFIKANEPKDSTKKIGLRTKVVQDVPLDSDTEDNEEYSF